ncbi:MAG: hypothetical protein IKE37_00700, partial [Firmicutes bacterium]|nr:hypothetical protein [Bacillota bacterium]
RTGAWGYLATGTWALMGVEINDPILTDRAYELSYTHEGGVTGDIPEGSIVEYSTDGGETWTTEPPSITDAGEEDYIVKVTNPDYEDAEDDGTLVVTPKPVTITADPKSKVYKEADPELTATEEGILEGESIEYSLFRDPGEDVGSYNISFVYEADAPETGAGFIGWMKRVFTPKSDKVRMGNYEVEFIDGEFDITARALTITASSAAKQYDGTPLTSESWTSSALAEGDVLQSVTIKGSQTEAGTSANVASAAKIVNEEGKDVTANYDITYVDGTLTVTAAPQPPVDPDKPKTGDDGAGSYPYMMIGSGAAILAMILGRKRYQMSRKNR